jgi:hypothetical protein
LVAAGAQAANPDTAPRAITVLAPATNSRRVMVISSGSSFAIVIPFLSSL